MAVAISFTGWQAHVDLHLRTGVVVLNIEVVGIAGVGGGAEVCVGATNLLAIAIQAAAVFVIVVVSGASNLIASVFFIAPLHNHPAQRHLVGVGFNIEFGVREVRTTGSCQISVLLAVDGELVVAPLLAILAVTIASVHRNNHRRGWGAVGVRITNIGNIIVTFRSCNYTRRASIGIATLFPSSEDQQSN